jgi:hypothetical protein
MKMYSPSDTAPVSVNTDGCFVCRQHKPTSGIYPVVFHYYIMKYKTECCGNKVIIDVGLNKTRILLSAG